MSMVDDEFFKRLAENGARTGAADARSRYCPATGARCGESAVAKMRRM